VTDPRRLVDKLWSYIYRKAQNRIQDPAKLKRLVVDLIDKEDWSATGTDIKGDAYEELLSKGAEDIKSGAGQYFTPRPLIQAMVDCVQPSVRDTVVDPAAGTGGFLLIAHDYAAMNAEKMTPIGRSHLRDSFVHGVELVDGDGPAGRDEPTAAWHRYAGWGVPHRVQGLPHRRSRPALVRRTLQPPVRSQVIADHGRSRRAGGA
jgi:N-6 DNA Methylase